MKPFRSNAELTLILQPSLQIGRREGAGCRGGMGGVRAGRKWAWKEGTRSIGNGEKGGEVRLAAVTRGDAADGQGAMRGEGDEAEAVEAEEAEEAAAQRMAHFRPFFFFTWSAARVAVSKTSRTPCSQRPAPLSRTKEGGQVLLRP